MAMLPWVMPTTLSWPGWLIFALHAAVILILLGWYRHHRGPPSVFALELPVFDSRDDDNSIVSTLERGHKHHPTTHFALAVPGQQLVVLPISEIDTVKALPDDQLSIKKHHFNQFLGEYSYMGTKADEFDDAMRYKLVRNTPLVLDAFTAEIEYAAKESIGGTIPDWSGFRPRAVMSRMAGILSGRSFVGLPLSRDEEWISATIGYTGDVSRAWVALRPYSRFVRPFVAPFLAEVRSLQARKAFITKKLAALLKHRQSQTERDNVAGSRGPGGELIDWFRSHYSHTPSVKESTRDQLLATFASIYNLANALTYIVFDLAANPDAVEELRQELLDVLGPDGIIDKASILKLRTLDSFVRESQRLSPPSLVNIPRIVTAKDGLKLTTGHVIPAGFLVMVRAQPINMSPDLYPEPDAFDAFRFARLREKEGNEMRFQHTSTGSDNINFGHGLWACPGGFFASALIKVVIAYMVRNYDLRFPHGREKPERKYYGLAILPDAEAEVEIRSLE